jgi:hydrogenase nickel incorporation protein HypA/HybF
MHELSIALSLIDAVGEEAERLGAQSVRAVHLRLGALSGVVKESLLGAFELAREGTRLEATTLKIVDVATVIHCSACNRAWQAESVFDISCPACGGPSSEIISGRELELSALEIEP